jgi:hypothetical protein
MGTIEIKTPEYAKQPYNGQVRLMHQIKLEIPKYSPIYGVWPLWENDAIVHVHIDQEREVVLQANKEGLISLARQLLTLAQDEAPSGSHIHYDENSLEGDSCELIIDKI